MIEKRDENWTKFDEEDKKYFEYLDQLEEMTPPIREIIYNFPVFVGHVNLARELFFYELYKKVLDYSGDIAEVGTYKGASFLLWAKLIRLFENNNTTRVFGFDWFEGISVGENDDASTNGLYKSDYETLDRLVKLQNLENIALLEKMDVTQELEPFLKERPYLRFKIVFIDCGIENVLDTSLRLLWPRLVRGGDSDNGSLRLVK